MESDINIMAAQNTPNTPAPAAQAPIDTTARGSAGVPPADEGRPDTRHDQAQRALTNQGDTVRASWRFSLDAIRGNIAYMSVEAKDLLVWAFNWCIDPAHPLRFADYCDRIGYSENTVYKIYSGKYRHPETNKLMDAPEKLVKALRDFRRLELQRAKMGRKQFVLTPTAKKFFWACDQARKSNSPVIVYGSSQIGKTEAARQYCIEGTHAVLVELDAVGGLRGALRAIAAKVGVNPELCAEKLAERIKKALNPDMVLIIDEVHLLANVYRKRSFFQCIEQLRRIQDFTKCGMVLTFTLLKYGEVENERKRELEQAFNRSPHRVNLGASPSAADMRAICEAHGLPWDERNEQVTVAKDLVDTPCAVLQQLAGQGLKMIIERIRLGNELAADDNREQVSWQDFLRSHYAIEKNAQMPDSGWQTKG